MTNIHKYKNNCGSKVYRNIKCNYMLGLEYLKADVIVKQIATAYLSHTIILNLDLNLLNS